MDIVFAILTLLALAAALEHRHRRTFNDPDPRRPDPRRPDPDDPDRRRAVAELRAAAGRRDSTVRRVGAALAAAGSAVPHHAPRNWRVVRPGGPTAAPRAADT
ncbi:MAG: hypothetical protein IPK37_08105 [Austwickia sp.]|jgi:hypothetical protein|nr:MAG: hypothetical protein IPK37_08105 [Austwickia sp.]